jgi:AAA family ATP:ADP antiporter
MGVSAGGQRTLTWLFMGTLATTLAIAPVFGALVSRYARRIFLPAIYLFFVSNLIGFYLLFSSSSPALQGAVSKSFFVWTSVFNLLAVSVFWGLMADLFESDQAERVFGLIGLGGTMGGITGSALTTLLSKSMGVLNLLLLSAGLLAVSLLCLARLLACTPSRPRRAAQSEKPPGTGALAGMYYAVRSRYLLGICGFMLLFPLSSTVLYFEQARIVRSAFESPAARTEFFATMDLYANVLTALSQLFLTGRILPALGAGPVLTFLPLITIAGFVSLILNPTATMIAIVQVLRRAAEFSFVKPAREVLFTVVSREEKYSSKAFIDTFVYRAGDSIGAWSEPLLKLVGVASLGAAGAFLPLGAVWLWLCLYLGKKQREMAGRNPDPSPARPLEN